MIAPKITTHVADALARLLTQYKDRPRIKALISAASQGYQDLEDAIYPFDSERSIFNAIGQQLDNVGTLVDLPRNGLTDPVYRLFILGKIAENNSNATADSVSAIYGLLLGANLIQEQDLPPANAGFSAGAALPDPTLIPLITQLIEKSLGAGISLDFLSVFDPVKPFATLGFPGPYAGFDDLTNMGQGGLLGTLL